MAEWVDDAPEPPSVFVLDRGSFDCAGVDCRGKNGLGGVHDQKSSDFEGRRPRRWRFGHEVLLGIEPSRRIVGRMPRVQVYLPDGLYAELKSRDLPASELLQVAVRAEIERRDALDATDEYLSELAAEVEEPSARDRARARAIVRRIQDRRLHEAG